MIPRLRLVGIVTVLAAIFVGSGIAHAQSSPWDDATSGAILAAIQKNPALTGSTITVDCYSGIVMLTGVVTNFELRDMVEQTVRQIPGTTRIINELNQDANRSPTDAQRDAAIQSTLDMTLAQYTSTSQSVVVARGHVYDGIVYLLGSVSDSSMNDIVQSSIMALPGVHAVVAHLAIQQQPTTPVRSLPPPETIAALPKALAHIHKPARRPVRPVYPQDEDETAARIAQSTPSPRPIMARDYAVQLASEFDNASAVAAWKRKKAANIDLLGALSPTVTRVDLGNKGIRFRLRAGPLPDQAAAVELCAALAKRQTACMVARNDVGSVAPAVSPVATAVTVAPKPERSPVPAMKPMPAAVASLPPAPITAKPSSPARLPHAAAPYYVQLASRSSEAAARDYWTTQHRAHSDLLGNLSPIVTPADLGPKGIMYRLKVGPLADRGAASALCAQLAKHQLDCLVVRDIPTRPAP